MNAPFAGTLRNRIQVDEPVYVRDPSGERVRTWGKVACMWARVQSRASREEGLVAGAVLATARYDIEIRYRTDISAEMSVLLPGPVQEERLRLDIVTEPVDPDGTRERTSFRCEYRGGEA